MPSPSIVAKDVALQLAPTGVLRAGINMSNFLLVSGTSPSGDPVGVAPDMARAIAERLGVPVAYQKFPRPGELADAAEDDVWDIGLIGDEPARAQKIAFSPAYVEIASTYLVPAGSPLRAIEEVDRPGIRIAVTARTAYELWLSRHIRHAELVRSDEPGRRARAVRRREAGRARRPEAAPPEGRREAAGRKNSRRPVLGGAAGDRHAAAARGGGCFPARLRRGSEGLGPGREPDRAPPHPGPLGRPARLSMPGLRLPVYSVVAGASPAALSTVRKPRWLAPRPSSCGWRAAGR